MHYNWLKKKGKKLEIYPFYIKIFFQRNSLKKIHYNQMKNKLSVYKYVTLWYVMLCNSFENEFKCYSLVIN